jgi:hypothetical protein
VLAFGYLPSPPRVAVEAAEDKARRRSLRRNKRYLRRRT